MEQMQEKINNTDQDIVLKIEKLIEEISMLQVERQNLKKEYEDKNGIRNIWNEANNKQKEMINKKFESNFFCSWKFRIPSIIIMTGLVFSIAFPVVDLLSPLIRVLMNHWFGCVAFYLTTGLMSVAIAWGISAASFIPELILMKQKKTELEKLEKLESFDRDAYEELIELEELLSHSKRKLNAKKKKLSKALEMLNQKCILESFQQNQIEQQMVEYYDDMYDAYSFKDVKMNNQNSEMDLQKEPYTKSSNHNLV